MDKNGFLTEAELNEILVKLDKSYDKEEIKVIFKAIDCDSSNTIDFLELNSYYSKMMGIPESMFLPENMKEKMNKRYNKAK